MTVNIKLKLPDSYFAAPMLANSFQRHGWCDLRVAERPSVGLCDWPGGAQCKPAASLGLRAMIVTPLFTTRQSADVETVFLQYIMSFRLSHLGIAGHVSKFYAAEIRDASGAVKFSNQIVCVLARISTFTWRVESSSWCKPLEFSK